jgi:hypothetical protein
VTLLLGLLGLAVAGCAGGEAKPASPSPSPSAWGAAYDSPALGVSLSHPEDWRVVRTVDPGESPTSVGDVEMHGPGGVVLDVSSTVTSVPDPPFDANGQFAADRDSAEIFDFRIVGQEVVSVAGQPFARTDMLVRGRHVATLTGLASGMLVGIEFHCPNGDWPAQSDVLDAVLSSMRFATPQSAGDGA